MDEDAKDNTDGRFMGANRLCIRTSLGWVSATAYGGLAWPASADSHSVVRSLVDTSLPKSAPAVGRGCTVRYFWFHACLCSLGRVAAVVGNFRNLLGFGVNCRLLVFPRRARLRIARYINPRKGRDAFARIR